MTTRPGETPPAGEDTVNPDAFQSEAEDVELVRDWANPFNDTFTEDHRAMTEWLANHPEQAAAEQAVRHERIVGRVNN